MLHHMVEDVELIGWARDEAGRLRHVASGDAVLARMAIPAEARGLGSAGLEFLRVHAGGSAFHSAAEESYSLTLHRPEAGLLATAEALDAWARYAEAGLTNTVSGDVQARAVASTDLMEQVQLLITDNSVHPAASVVLAGAALEEFLRAKVIANDVPIAGKPGISSYAAGLRTAGLIGAQDSKDITSWAGQRNEAAHGQFEMLSRPRAQIMIDGINLFLQINSVERLKDG